MCREGGRSRYGCALRFFDGYAAFMPPALHPRLYWQPPVSLRYTTHNRMESQGVPSHGCQRCPVGPAGSRLASGLAHATVTPNMDWIVTARVRTAHTPAVVQTVLRTMEFDMAAPAQIGLTDCPQIIQFGHSRSTTIRPAGLALPQ